MKFSQDSLIEVNFNNFNIAKYFPNYLIDYNISVYGKK